MSLIINALQAFILGVLSFYAVGFLAALLLPWDEAEPIVMQYIRMATGTLKRGLLIKRSHGGWTLKKTSFDAGVGREVTTLDGETYGWHDYRHFMTKLHTATFGLAHEDKDAIFDARVADWGRRFRELKESGSWTQNGARKTYFDIPNVRHLVSLDDALHIIPGSSSPRLADRLEEDIKKSQALFNSRRGEMVQTLQLLMFFGAGFGAMYVAFKLGAKSSGGTVSTISLGVLPLLSTDASGVATRIRESDVDVRELLEQIGLSVGLLGIGAGVGIAVYATEILPMACSAVLNSPFEPASACEPYRIARRWMTRTVVGGGLVIVATIVPSVLDGETDA